MKTYKINDPKAPWNKPNNYGELPGDICCKRTSRGKCHEHNPCNYPKQLEIPCPYQASHPIQAISFYKYLNAADREDIQEGRTPNLSGHIYYDKSDALTKNEKNTYLKHYKNQKYTLTKITLTIEKV